MTGVLLGEETVTGSSTSTISFTSIDQNYDDLMVIGSMASDTTTGFGATNLYIKPNSESSSMCMAASSRVQYSPTNTNMTRLLDPYWIFEEMLATAKDSDMSFSPLYIYLPSYASSTIKLNGTVRGGVLAGTPGGASSGLFTYSFEQVGAIVYDRTNAITQLDIYPSHGSIKAGSKLSLYGI